MDAKVKEYRAWLKDKCNTHGLSSLEPMQRLELILFYCIPANNVSECASALVSHFGSVEEVFGASYESLLEVPTMSENAATFIKLIPDICLQYAKSASESSVLSGFASVREFFKAQYYGIDREVVKLIFFDRNLKVVKQCTIADGTTSYAMLDTKLVVSEALDSKCKTCILSHNHPQGNCKPSNEDYLMTKGVRELLHMIGVALADHVIVGNDGVWSMNVSSMI